MYPPRRSKGRKEKERAHIRTQRCKLEKKSIHATVCETRKTKKEEGRRDSSREKRGARYSPPGACVLERSPPPPHYTRVILTPSGEHRRAGVLRRRGGARLCVTHTRTHASSCRHTRSVVPSARTCVVTSRLTDFSLPLSSRLTPFTRDRACQLGEMCIH